MSLDVTLKSKKDLQTIDSYDNIVFDYNITHNLGNMADKAGIYYYLWRPEEVSICRAGDLINPLIIGLKKLIDEKETMELLNPSNGWGDYNGLVEFVGIYLIACVKYPEAEIEISR